MDDRLIHDISTKLGVTAAVGVDPSYHDITGCLLFNVHETLCTLNTMSIEMRSYNEYCNHAYITPSTVIPRVLGNTVVYSACKTYGTAEKTSRKFSQPQPATYLRLIQLAVLASQISCSAAIPWWLKRLGGLSRSNVCTSSGPGYNKLRALFGLAYHVSKRYHSETPVYTRYHLLKPAAFERTRPHQQPSVIAVYTRNKLLYPDSTTNPQR